MISVVGKNRGHTKCIAVIDLAVCILFYEKLDQTIECIQSFLSSGVNIYILNNGSSIPARHALGRFCNNYKQIEIFDSEVNLGVGVGRNYLVTHTSKEWLLFVDNDIIVKTPDWLQKFARHVCQYPDTEVFIPRLFNAQTGDYSSFTPFTVVGNKVIRVRDAIGNITNNFPGGASFVNRKLFDRLGFYDDEMLVGLEDYELCVRAIRLGETVRARHIYDIELTHDHRQPKERGDRNALLVRYDVNHIEASLNRIAEKHNLILEGNWISGTANCVEKMLKNDNPTLKKNRKQWVLNQAKNILGHSTEMAVSFASFVLPYRAKGILRQMLHLYMPIPRSCSLFMTDRCNFKYRRGYRSVIGIKESKEMTLATVQKLLSLYPSLDAFTVTGLGEPTLCPNFVDIVNFLKKNGKFVGVITNGTNSDKFLALAYEPNYILISLNGYDNESYLANTGVAAFDVVMETVSKLKLRFKNVGFYYMLNRSNYKDLEKLLPLCDDLKPEFLHLTNYLVYDPTIKEEVQKIITVKDTHIINYINDICTGRDYIRVKPVYVDFGNPKFNCRSYDCLINLDGDGNIGGCQWQVPPDASFGNIFTDKDPFNSLEMRGLRDLMHDNYYAHDECRFCFVNCES